MLDLCTLHALYSHKNLICNEIKYLPVQGYWQEKNVLKILQSA
jgi:hypothetical protein